MAKNKEFSRFRRLLQTSDGWEIVTVFRKKTAMIYKLVFANSLRRLCHNANTKTCNPHNSYFFKMFSNFFRLLTTCTLLGFNI